jgi:hypothetical protein
MKTRRHTFVLSKELTTLAARIGHDEPNHDGEHVTPSERTHRSTPVPMPVPGSASHREASCCELVSSDILRTLFVYSVFRGVVYLLTGM